jgi:hypothetical protein
MPLNQQGQELVTSVVPLLTSEDTDLSVYANYTLKLPEEVFKAIVAELEEDVAELLFSVARDNYYRKKVEGENTGISQRDYTAERNIKWLLTDRNL